MTKDYAKKRRLHTQRARGQTPEASSLSMPMWAWMIAGLTLGLTLAAVLYWKLNAKHHLPQVATISIEEVGQHGTTKQQVSAESQDENSNRFDFYTVLPNMTMDIPESVSTPSSAKPNAVIAEAPSTPTLDLATQDPVKDFIVQVGSFRTLAQAEELKAKLALAGMQASVQTFEKSPTETWHRVYVGPFANKQEAVALQHQLQQTHALHSLVLKMRV